MTKLRAIIFDFDGTLYSGEPFDKWNEFVMNAITEIFSDTTMREEFVHKYPQVLNSISSSELAGIIRQELG